MKFKLVLGFCALGLISSINAMLSRSPGALNVSTTAGISDTDQEVLRLINNDQIKDLEDMLKKGEISPDAIILGKSILWWAITYGRLNIVKKLIESGALVEDSDTKAAHGSNDIAKVLQEAKETQEIR